MININWKKIPESYRDQEHWFLATLGELNKISRCARCAEIMRQHKLHEVKGFPYEVALLVDVFLEAGIFYETDDDLPYQ